MKRHRFKTDIFDIASKINDILGYIIASGGVVYILLMILESVEVNNLGIITDREVNDILDWWEVAVIAIAAINLSIMFFNMLSSSRRSRKELQKEIDSYTSILRRAKTSRSVSDVLEYEERDDRIDANQHSSSPHYNTPSSERKPEDSEDVIEHYNPLDLLNATLIEMKKYYEISRSQAKTSFNWSIAACLLGFALLATPLIASFFPNSNVESSILTVAGGIMIELFAGTTMLVYKSSTGQLKSYYDAIQQNERYLSCVNLADRLSTSENKDLILMEIIRAEMYPTIPKSEASENAVSKTIRKVKDVASDSLKDAS
jgi:hypothetical protein